MNTALQKLNVGCGRNVMPGWINLDSFPLPGVDIVGDLEACARFPLPLNENSVDELRDRMQRDRNVVTEMVATLRAVKPIRQPLRELQAAPRITLLR